MELATARIGALDDEAPPRGAAGSAARAPSRAAEPPELGGDDRLGIAWLIRLRWGAVLGQAAAIALAGGWWQLPLSYPVLVGVLAVTALSNLAIASLPASWPRAGLLWPVVVLDVALLTATLAGSGGPANPFSVFYLVYVALAAVLLRPGPVWSIVGLSIAAFGILFAVPGGWSAHGAGPSHGHDGGAFVSHLAGMWLAYALAAGFVAYFVGRVTRAMREREHQLAQIAALAAQNERLATLSSFSTNAAHELGSPLATIGLAAGELAAAADAGTLTGPLADDARLVASQVARCREILADLSARAGESLGEMPTRFEVSELVDALAQAPAALAAGQVELRLDDPAVGAAPLVAPKRTLVQMVNNLVRNALEAQEADDRAPPVEVEIGREDQLLRIRVLDRGSGIDPALADRIGAPFITTRAERGGLGLGLYLVHAYAIRTGGSLRVRPRPGGGTVATLRVAMDVLQGAGRDPGRSDRP